MNTVFLKGRRVYLRPVREADAGQWYKWFNDEAVTFYMDKHRFPNTVEKQLEYFRQISKSTSDIQLAVIYAKKDELIGTVGLHQIDYINSNADISVVIGEKRYWRRGLGREAVSLVVRHAFNNLNLHKLTAGMSADNLGSFRLFQSLGFKKEALLREQLFLRGEYKDIIRLGLLKKDFRERI